MIIIAILLSLVCHSVLRKYDLRKYVNIFKARIQSSVNKYNPACAMCYCGMHHILFLLHLIWPRRFYLAGDMTNLYSFMLKRLNILPTRTSFFISSAGKIENVQEFKVKLFE